MIFTDLTKWKNSTQMSYLNHWNIIEKKCKLKYNTKFNNQINFTNPPCPFNLPITSVHASINSVQSSREIELPIRKTSSFWNLETLQDIEEEITATIVFTRYSTLDSKTYTITIDKNSKQSSFQGKTNPNPRIFVQVGRTGLRCFETHQR